MSSHQTALLMVGMIIGLHFIVRQLAQVELWTSTQAVLLGVHRPRNIVSLVVAIGWDIIFLMLSTLFTFSLILQDPITVAHLAVCILIPFATIYFYGVYRTVWTRSRASQLLVLMLQLAAGEVLAFVALIWIIDLTLFDLLVALLLHYLGSAVGIVGGRVSLRLVRDLNAWLRCSMDADHDLASLILGAGENAILYLRQASFADQQRAPRKIIGLIDDNPALHNKMVYGYPVLGSFEQLEEIVRTRKIQEVIFTHHYNDELRKSIFALKEKYNLLIREFVFIIRDLDQQGACRGVLKPSTVDDFDCRTLCGRRMDAEENGDMGADNEDAEHLPGGE